MQKPPEVVNKKLIHNLKQTILNQADEIEALEEKVYQLKNDLAIALFEYKDLEERGTTLDTRYVRTQIAADALNGLLANPDNSLQNTKTLVSCSVAYADALIAELEKTNG